MRLTRSLFLPALSGVLYFVSWIGFGIWPLAFVCFVPQVLALRDANGKQALRRGLLFGFVTHLGGYVWIVHLLRTFAFFPLWLATLGYFVVCAAQGGLFAVFSWALRRTWTATGWPLTALLPLCLVATEFVYPLLFQSYTGVALMPAIQLVQIADLGGVLLLSALQGLVNGAIADALLRTTSLRRALAPLAIAIATLAAAFTYGALRIRAVERREEAAPQIRVGIAQPDVGEIELHKNPYASVLALTTQTAELSARGADLVIWPEVGYNLRAIRDGDDGRQISNGIPVWLIAGVERAGRSKERWNSAIVVSPEGKIGDHFDKIALLAFGEYIPFGDWFPFLYEWSPLASHLTRGTTTAPLHAAGYRFATFICYEDILPRIVRDTMSDHGDGRAHALVNLTNDSWYGAWHEQIQHLMLAAVRTIEHRRWLVRATSTGISAFVDANGRVLQSIEKDLRGISIRDVPMLSGTTPYEVLGEWPGWLSLLVLAWIGVREFRRRRKERADGGKPVRSPP
ncbi:MAG: apolipoprotein N-acyltransferase [Myxococcales bacterium]